MFTAGEAKPPECTDETAQGAALVRELCRPSPYQVHPQGELTENSLLPKRHAPPRRRLRRFEPGPWERRKRYRGLACRQLSGWSRWSPEAASEFPAGRPAFRCMRPDRSRVQVCLPPVTTEPGKPAEAYPRPLMHNTRTLLD